MLRKATDTFDPKRLMDRPNASATGDEISKDIEPVRGALPRHPELD